jgi:hypothetical protein
MKLCAVQLKAYVLSLFVQMQQPTFRKFNVLLVLLLRTQLFCGVFYICPTNAKYILTISVTSALLHVSMFIHTPKRVSYYVR